MNMTIADILESIAIQQLSALQTILEKAKTHAAENNLTQESLLATRLHPDMHPLSWQINTTLELVLRSMQRLSGQDPTEIDLTELNFDQMIAEIKSIQSGLSKSIYEASFLDLDTTITIPIGPDNSLSLSAQDYLLKFTLPNVYFHLTTTYDILRMTGVELGKRDFMGPIL
jgi:hypothetical protein